MAKASKGEKRLKELEKEIKSRGVYLGYERLLFAGLVLKSGMCWFKGRYYLFVDLRKKLRERIELLETALDELDALAAAGRLDRPFDPDGPAEGEAPQPGTPADAEPSPESAAEPDAPAGQAAPKDAPPAEDTPPEDAAPEQAPQETPPQADAPPEGQAPSEEDARDDARPGQASPAGEAA